MWDTFTRHSGSYLWPIEYEPRVGGSETGLTQGGGTVTVWEPHRHFATRTRPEHERDGLNEIDFELEPLGEITYLRYTHRAEIPEAEYDLQLAMCRAHTAFYQHSLGQAACYFPGRTRRVRGRRRGRRQLRRGVRAARRARRAPSSGTGWSGGVIDYLTPSFLGIRGADQLFRVYGRDTWGYPVGTTTHRFPTRTEA